MRLRLHFLAIVSLVACLTLLPASPFAAEQPQDPDSQAATTAPAAPSGTDTKATNGSKKNSSKPKSSTTSNDPGSALRDFTIEVERSQTDHAIEKETLVRKALEQSKNGETSISDKDLMPEDAPVLEGEEYDLERSVKRALEANPRIASAQAELDGSEAGRKSARGDFFPSLNTSYGYSHYDHLKPNTNLPRSLQKDNNIFQLVFNVHQELFNGLKTLSAYQKAALNKTRAEANLANVELSLILTVQENFLNMLKARESVRSAKDSVTRLSSQLQVTTAFYDVGLKPRLDVLQAEVDLSRAQDQLLQARNTVATQQARLNTLLIFPLDAKIYYKGELSQPPFSIPLEDCLDQAYKNRPDLKIAQKLVEMAGQDANIARSGFFPQISADYNNSRSGSSFDVRGTDYNSPGRTEFAQWNVAVQAQWKIFDFGSTYYGWRKAKEGIKQYQAEEENTRQEATYQVKAKHLKIYEAEERIKVAKKAVESATEGYRMAVARYQAQVGTNIDVLDAQEKLTQAEYTLTSALAEYQIALASIYVAIGEKNYSLITN